MSNSEKYTLETPLTLQSGIRQYNGDLTRYTGMLGGLTPDVHTLRSLNPLTNNRLLCVMYRGPYYLIHYFAGGASANAYSSTSPFATYKKLIEYYNMGIQVNMGDNTLASVPLQGGFAGRSINIPTTQNTQAQQTLVITVPELVGRPVATFHNMWVDGISDPVTGLATYHGLVAGSVNEGNVPQRIFKPNSSQNDMALEPSPAYEVAEFLIIALDRSGARVEGAVMALGCVPATKVNGQLFTSNNQGNSALETLQLTFNCQFIQSTYVNDLAARYVNQFAVFGNSLNLNPGAGDAFFDSANSTTIDTEIFNKGNRPDLDSVQSGMGNAPIFKANPKPIVREPRLMSEINPIDHMRIRNDNDTFTTFPDPYQGNPSKASTYESPNSQNTNYTRAEQISALGGSSGYTV